MSKVSCIKKSETFLREHYAEKPFWSHTSGVTGFEIFFVSYLFSLASVSDKISHELSQSHLNFSIWVK